jgi:predicted negative regulator of RcsB-dependent stress response
MKAERRHTLQTNALATAIARAPELWQKHGGRVLVGVVAVLALILLLRWRNSQTLEASQIAAQALAQARDEIQQAAMTNISRMRAEDVYATRAQVIDVVRDLTTLALEQTEDSVLRAQALLIRGDLHWALATAPQPAPETPSTQPTTQPTTEPAAALPTTAPTAKPGMSSAEHLAAAAAAYEQVIAEYPQQAHAVAAAHLGLATIFETRGSFDEAQTHYQAVAQGESFAQVYRTVAEARLAELPLLRQTPIMARPATSPADLGFLSEQFPPEPLEQAPFNLELPEAAPAEPASAPAAP